MATITIQSSNPIEAATRRHRLVFAVYIAVLVFTALLIAFMTWLEDRAGSGVQDAIRQDADARIQEAARGVMQLQNENLKLSGDLETEKGKVAGLQRDASYAKAEQEKVEIALNEQREKTATAERDLLEVRKHQEPRNLDPVDLEKLRKFLSDKPKFPLIISCIAKDQEACTFARQIRRAFSGFGWEVPDVAEKDFAGTPAGISMLVPSENARMPLLTHVPTEAQILSEAFAELGMRIDFRFPISMALPPNTVELVVGHGWG